MSAVRLRFVPIDGDHIFQCFGRRAAVSKSVGRKRSLPNGRVCKSSRDRVAMYANRSGFGWFSRVLQGRRRVFLFFFFACKCGRRGGRRCKSAAMAHLLIKGRGRRCVIAAYANEGPDLYKPTDGLFVDFFSSSPSSSPSTPAVIVLSQPADRAVDSLLKKKKSKKKSKKKKKKMEKKKEANKKNDAGRHLVLVFLIFFAVVISSSSSFFSFFYLFIAFSFYSRIAPFIRFYLFLFGSSGKLVFRSTLSYIVFEPIFNHFYRVFFSIDLMSIGIAVLVILDRYQSSFTCIQRRHFTILPTGKFGVDSFQGSVEFSIKSSLNFILTTLNSFKTNHYQFFKTKVVIVNLSCCHLIALVLVKRNC